MLWFSCHLATLFERATTLPYLLQLHSLLLKTALDHHPFLVSKLVAALCPLSLHHARSFFSHLPCPPPMYAWNSLIRALAISGSPLEAIHLFSVLQRQCQPDNFTYPFVLGACGCASKRESGEMVHGLVVKDGFLSDRHVGNALLHLYVSCGTIGCARKVFDEMSVRDVVSWTSMMQGYVACGHPLQALMMFLEMIETDVMPNSVTLLSLLSACSYLGCLRTGRSIHSYITVNSIKLDVSLGAALVNMYAKCGLLDDALRLFNSLDEKSLQSWTIMISGFTDHGLWKEAIGLFSQMEASGAKPDSTFFSIILCACSHLGMVEGLKMFDRMVTEYGVQPTIEHYGCMVDLLARAGRLESAYEFIKNMPIAPSNAIMRSILGACRNTGKFSDADEGMVKLLLEKEPDLGSNYVIAADLSALSCQWRNMAKLRSTISERQLKKVSGYSWVEVNGRSTT